MDTIPVKPCTKCGVPKAPTPEHFSKSKTGKFGLRSICKLCESAKKREAYRLNPERAIERAKVYYDANREKVRDYKRAYRLENLEKERARSKDWYRNNKERSTQSIRAWNEANPEKVSAYKKSWVESNPKKRQAVSKGWKIRNPEQVKFSNRVYRLADPSRTCSYRQMRRSRLKNAEGSFTAAEWEAKLELYNGRCHWCGGKIKGSPHADHVVALSKGGSNDISNVVPSCSGCNLSKGAKSPLEFANRLF